MSRTTIEGIFDVEHKRSGYNEFISETFKTAQGNVVDIEEEEFMYRSTAAYTNITKRICGVVLTLQNERGMEKVNFPKELSLYDKKMIRNQQVKYSHNIWSTTSEGTSDTYTLEILTGELVGEKSTKRVFV